MSDRRTRIVLGQRSAEELAYRLGLSGVHLGALGRELEQVRRQLVDFREVHGLPIEETPKGKRVVVTGVVTHCCGSHVPGRVIASCCDPDDCGPCCPECPTCPTLNRVGG